MRCTYEAIKVSKDMLLAKVNHSPSQTGAVVDNDSGHNRMGREVPVVHQRSPKANQANDQRHNHLWRRPWVLDSCPGERKNARCCASDDDCVPAVIARLSAINPVSVMKSGGRVHPVNREERLVIALDWRLAKAEEDEAHGECDPAEWKVQVCGKSEGTPTPLGIGRVQNNLGRKEERQFIPSVEDHTGTGEASQSRSIYLELSHFVRERRPASVAGIRPNEPMSGPARRPARRMWTSQAHDTSEELNDLERYIPRCAIAR